MQRRPFLKFFTLLLASLSLKLRSKNNKSEDIFFNHGVASGDPTHTNVIIWTKLTKSSNSSIQVNWEISDNIDFINIINQGQTEASGYNNFTVKVDVKIPKQYNGISVFYRFSCNNQFSEIGKTITLPIYNPDEFNIAFCSCSNYPAGFCYSYKNIANNDEIDIVLHLGDYMYEYNQNEYEY